MRCALGLEVQVVGHGQDAVHGVGLVVEVEGLLAPGASLEAVAVRLHVGICRQVGGSGTDAGRKRSRGRAEGSARGKPMRSRTHHSTGCRGRSRSRSCTCTARPRSPSTHCGVIKSSSPSVSSTRRSTRLPDRPGEPNIRKRMSALLSRPRQVPHHRSQQKPRCRPVMAYSRVWLALVWCCSKKVLRIRKRWRPIRSNRSSTCSNLASRGGRRQGLGGVRSGGRSSLGWALRLAHLRRGLSLPTAPSGSAVTVALGPVVRWRVRASSSSVAR